MPGYKDNISEALEQYPQAAGFLRWRSTESMFAANYLREQIKAGIDEVTLKALVDFLLTGMNPPKNKPGQMVRLKINGRLYTLLTTAKNLPATAIPQWKLKTDKLLDTYNGGTRALATDPAAAFIDLFLRRKYDRAIATWLVHDPGGDTYWKAANKNKLAVLAPMTRDEHLEVIDNIWSDLLELKVGSTEVRNMVDPGSAQAYPSSTHLADAFKAQGYCFRCDTRQPDSVAQTGFRRRYEFDCPEDIRDTLPHRAAKGDRMTASLGMWKDNRDAISEMVICVSRQMRGCTKFPSSDYEGDAWIYALCLPLDKKGFDTEAWQVQLGRSLWKPGEKAFYDLQAENVLASVPIRKSKGQMGEFFRFQILSDHWTFHHASVQQQAHLNQELGNLYNAGQVQAIGQNEDFIRA